MQQQMLQQAAQDPQAQQMIMQMQIEMEHMQSLLQNDILITTEEIKRIREYYQYTHKEFEEKLCSQALEEFIDSKRLRHLMNNFFEEMMITGEPIWYCDWEPGLAEPEVRLIRPEYLWYQANEASKYLHELDWIVEYSPMSIGQVIQYYGADITEENLETLRSEFPMFSQDAWYRTNLTNFPDGSPSGWYSGNDYLYSHQVDTYKVNWKEQVEVYALYSENKNDTPYFSEKPPFVKFLTPEEYQDLTSTESKRKRLEKKGQKILKAYRVDRWSGVRIGTMTYIKIKKHDFQYRTHDRLSDIALPYIGFANNRFYKAYSPLWETKDIQELYNILHYQEELLIALSGVKGIIYDLSQMPSGMTPQEVMYYMKQGLGLIETVKPNGKAVRTSFNQFATYDMTVSPAIQSIMVIKESLNTLAGEITGVTRQKTGQVLASDQVGTSQMALAQSNVVTEYYFMKVDELNELLFTRLCNIFPYAYAEGKRGMYVVGKERQEILNIQKDQLKGEFRSIVNSGSKEREIMRTAKQMAQMKFQQGQIGASDFLDLLDTDTMFEMRKLLKDAEQRVLETSQKMQSDSIEQQKQAQMEVEQMKAQIQQQVAQMSSQVESQLLQLKGQIDLQKEQMKIQNAQTQMQVQQQLETEKIAADKEKVENEKQVELAYLNFAYTELEVNATNQRAQMLINRAKTALEMKSSAKKERVKD
jgi:cell division septum initiation protein DivIVA